MFDAAITVAVARNRQGQPTEARWLVRDISEQQAMLRDRKQAELASFNHDRFVTLTRTFTTQLGKVPHRLVT